MKYCKNCGNQLPDNVKFCGKCGNPVIEEENSNLEQKNVQKPKKKSRKKLFIILGIVIVLAVIVVAACIVTQNKKRAEEYENYITMAEKYVEELDYEQAETSYLKAIEVAPKKAEPYLGLARIYVVQEDCDKAETILEQANETGVEWSVEDVAEKEEIEEQIEEIRYVITYSEKADSIWEEFLASGEFEDYVEVYDVSSLEYAIADLNGDSISELLITAMDLEFATTWAFVLDDGEIARVEWTDVVGNVESEDYTYGFSYCRYSSAYNALIVAPLRPSAATSFSVFYTLNGTKFEYAFQVGQDEGSSFYSDANENKEITDDEMSVYFADVENFEWVSVKSPSTVSVERSSKTDLAQYIGTDIYDLAKIIGDMTEEDSSMGIIYSNNAITISGDYSSNAVYNIYITDACDYSIKGIEYGMSKEDAFVKANKSCSSIADDSRSGYKTFIMDDGTTLSFGGDGDTVEVIDFWK